MWFTGPRRGGALALALAFGWPGPAPGADGETGAAVVARLYKDFAWQAIAAPPQPATAAAAVFGRELARQARPVLERYFDPALAALIVRDARCAVKTRELCHLDFDPLFASQDPAAADLAVRQPAPGRVVVAFTYPSSAEKIELEFRGARVAGKWRISDIIYRNRGDASLRAIMLGAPP